MEAPAGKARNRGDMEGVLGLLQRRLPVAAPPWGTVQPLPLSVPVAPKSRSRLARRMSETPEDLLYSKSHEWVRLQGQEATIGITDHAQEALNDIVYVELP